MIESQNVLILKKQGFFYKAENLLQEEYLKLKDDELDALNKLDVMYRSLCAILYNFAQTGHPGGSISSGKIVQNLLFNQMSYNFKNPEEESADIISYAAGHKALGLYALWALRNEIVKTYAPEMLADVEYQIRFEDLLGFRKSPANNSKLFKEFNAKSLDGHPEPLTPFVKLATGASGVGFGASVGLALGAALTYPKNTPKVHVVEGEGGLTAGRCSEAMAIASRAGLDNLIVHLDWNQASIDSDKVTAENNIPGDYVTWEPAELFYLNGFNIICVNEGLNFAQIYAAQKFAETLNNGLPTAIIYRTIKGWHYGLEGKASHGGGHKLCSPEFYKTMEEFENTFGVKIPHLCEGQEIEDCFYQNLLTLRNVISSNKDLFARFADKVKESANRLQNLERKAKEFKTEDVYTAFTPDNIPQEFIFQPSDNPTLRSTTAQALAKISKETNGTLIVATADLSGSTGAGKIAYDSKGFYNKLNNPDSRLISSGGITEDGLSAVMSGVSAYGKQLGVAASYGAFTSAMMHTQARLHAIGQQGYQELTGKGKNTFIIFTGHAGLPTGPDGPTHADPQMLQLISENFPKGAAITLTPLDANDVWPVLTAALNKRPAVLYPVVTRPNVKITDRVDLGSDKQEQVKNGVYALYKHKYAQGTVILQGSGVGEIFVQEVLPRIRREGVAINAYYIVSPELFDMLGKGEQEKILPLSELYRAIAITDFTLPTMRRWLKSVKGEEMSLYPFKKGKYLTSGQAADCYKEAGLDADAQYEQIREYLQNVENWY
ncbi:MAG: hypothetical protein J5594_04580 [Elusimicrobiaceae bacterium]|nr:hypothetical protein [Elusimicrobiaceae bacterium]